MKCKKKRKKMKKDLRHGGMTLEIGPNYPALRSGAMKIWAVFLEIRLPAPPVPISNTTFLYCIWVQCDCELVCGVPAF